MVDHFGLDVVQAYMRHVQDNAEEAVRRVIDALRRRRVRLRDGQRRRDRGAGHRRPDERGRRPSTSPAPRRSSNQLQRPASVATAAVLYVFRTLVADDIPLNDGCLKPLRIVVPRRLDARAGAIRRPSSPATSRPRRPSPAPCTRRSASRPRGPGTMNNFTFGNDRDQYYETVAAGSGAGDGFDGAPVVQTHMTNSRLTDPEVLEWRYPVRLEEFAVRRGSGGAGPVARRRRRGPADPLPGADDREHAVRSPPGAAVRHGGRQTGRARRETGSSAPTATCAAMGGSDSVDVGPGDVLVVETPGGGGYGPADGH